MKLSTITLLAGFLMAAQNIDAATITRYNAAINRDKVIKIINNSDREITFQAEYPDAPRTKKLIPVDPMDNMQRISIDRQTLAPNTSYNIKLVGTKGRPLSQIQVDMTEKGSGIFKQTYSSDKISGKTSITITNDAYSLE